MIVFGNTVLEERIVWSDSMVYSIPYSFIPGTKARAQEVNANFKYVLDTADEINTAKLNTSLSNITPEAIDIIRNCTSFRNIGEIIQCTTPLADAGIHLLDGSLLQEGAYSDFIDYIAELFDDTNKYNNNLFTKVGTPDVTSDGIASGFSAYNYLTKHNAITISDSGEFHIDYEFSCSQSTDIQYIFDIQNTTSNDIILRRAANSNDYYLLVFVGGSVVFNQGITVSSSDLSGYFEYKNGSYKWVLNDLSKTASGTKLPAANYTVNFGVRDVSGTIQQPLVNGSFDLKNFTVYVDDIKVLSGNESSVYFTDETSWQNSVVYNGLCNKFVYNSSDNTVRLPKYNDNVYLSTGRYYYIVIGTSVKTDIQVDIDDVMTDLNAKADKDLTNITTGAFEHVLATAQQTGKDIVINWGMPDYTAGVSVSAVPYTCPCNGIIVSPYNITINGSQIFTFYDYNGVNTPNSMTAPVCKGDVISGNVADMKFYPLKGES